MREVGLHRPVVLRGIDRRRIRDYHFVSGHSRGQARSISRRRLIFGELQDYQGGIGALQKYLKLEPGASNAGVVQIKIYQWESLVPGAAK